MRAFKVKLQRKAKTLAGLVSRLAGECGSSMRSICGNHRYIDVLFEQSLHHNWEFFRWVQRNKPEAYKFFRFVSSRSPLARPFKGSGLLVNWVQDPVRERSKRSYARLKKREDAYASLGLPVVNRIDALSNSRKSVALKIFKKRGIKCAKVTECGKHSEHGEITGRIGSPFLVRSDCVHSQRLLLIESEKDFEGIRWNEILSPVATEFIDTRSPDGYYRKYRYVLFGDSGAPRHLVISDHWCVHADGRLRGPSFLDEELAYIRSRHDPFHKRLNEVRKDLGLDYVAFDYSVDREGEPVLWEPNPFPVIVSRENIEDPYYRYQDETVANLFSLHLKYLLNTAQIAI